MKVMIQDHSRGIYIELPGYEARSVVEVIIKTLATQLVATGCYAHFLGLINTTGHLRAIYVAAFICCPFTAIAQLVFGAANAIYCYRKFSTPRGYRGSTFNYYAHATFNYRVESISATARNVPLVRADRLLLERRKKFFSWARFGRIVLCLPTLTQLTASAVVNVRRFNMVYSVTSLDVMNRNTALCAIPSAILTIYILSVPMSLKTRDWVSAKEFDLSKQRELRRQLPFAVSIALGLRLETDLLYLKHIEQIYDPFWNRVSFVWLYNAILVLSFVPLGHWVFVVSSGLYDGFGRRMDRLTRRETQGWHVVIVCMALLLLQQVVQLVVCGAVVLRSDGGGWKDPLSEKLFTV